MINSQSLLKPLPWVPGFNSNHPLARNVAGAWPMWENSGLMVADVSGNGHHLTITSPATPCWTAGKYGPEVIVNNGPYLSNTTMPKITVCPFSVAVIGFDDKSAVNAAIVGSRASANAGWTLDLEEWNNTGKVGITYRAVANYSDFGSTNYSTPTIPTVVLWSVPASGGVPHLCVNGIISVYNGTIGAMSASDLDGILIGCGMRDGGVLDKMHGNVALAVVWRNRLLNDIEMQDFTADPWAMFRPANPWRRMPLYTGATSVSGAPPSALPHWYYEQMRKAQ